MKLHLSARPPFSFRAVADSHGWRQLAPFAGDADGLSTIVRLVELGPPDDVAFEQHRLVDLARQRLTDARLACAARARHDQQRQHLEGMSMPTLRADGV